MRSFELAAAIFAIAPLFAQQPPPLQTLKVHVVHGLTGDPLPDVDLSLANARFEQVAGPVTTDRQGNGELRVNPGSYILSADVPGIGPVNYDDRADGMIFLVQLRPGSESTAVTFRIIPASTISGIVRDELGEPVPQANVSALRPYWNDGAVEFGHAGGATTDDRGFYKIFNMRAGGYAICAQANGPRRLPVRGPVDLSSPPPPRFYEPACAPTTDPVLSSLLHIGPGENLNIDLMMRSAAGVEIKGHLPKATLGISLSLTSSKAWPETHYPVEYTPGEERAFAIHGVPPGKYRIEGSITLKDVDDKNTVVPIELPLDTAGPVELDLTPPPATTVSLAYDETVPGLSKQVDSVNLQLAGRNKVHVAVKHEERGFSFDGLAGGTYWLHHFFHEEGACIAGARLGDKDVFRKSIQIPPGTNERLVLTVSSACGTIEGRVVSAGAPVARARVAILLSGTPQDPGFCFTLVSGDDGKFSITAIAPGRYLLWTWKDDGSGTSPGPASLAEVEALATVVDLPVGTATIEVPLLGSESKGGTQ